MSGRGETDAAPNKVAAEGISSSTVNSIQNSGASVKAEGVWLCRPVQAVRATRITIRLMLGPFVIRDDFGDFLWLGRMLGDGGFQVACHSKLLTHDTHVRHIVLTMNIVSLSGRSS